MTSYRIQGREVRLPVEIRRAQCFFASFLVPLGPARRLIAYSGLSPAEPMPGRAMCSLAFVRYEDGDLDAYDEVAVAFVVREHDAPAGAGPWARAREVLSGRVGAFIHRLPVTQPFTCEAGRTIWGFPKVLSRIDIDKDPRGATGRLSLDGELVLSMHVSRGLQVPSRRAGVAAYAFDPEGDGLTRTEWSIDGDRFGASLGGGALLELGRHPVAEELRALGLPRRAAMSGSVQGMRAVFHAPARVGRDAAGRVEPRGVELEGRDLGRPGAAPLATSGSARAS